MLYALANVDVDVTSDSLYATPDIGERASDLARVKNAPFRCDRYIELRNFDMSM